ncbi:MAG: metal ABC transporter permease [Candidatus Electrothrix scaldis]|nr:MAG: metal ABC transporter permease [Candidatus Electrothrix sp. GW3-3]
MDFIYDIFKNWAAQGYLPAIFEHTFMIRGLLAALVIGPLLGAIGTVVVTKKLSFFTQTIGNAAMSGVAIGLLLGEPVDGTYAGLYGFCLIIALLMTFVKNRTRLANDTIIGVVLAQVLGLGIILMIVVTSQFNIHQVEGILFGSLITLNDKDLIALTVASVVVGILFACNFNQFMLASFNRTLAKARGLSPVFLEYLFVTLMTIVVVSSLKLIGALLVLVLIVVPAAGAQLVAPNLRCFVWLSVVFSTISTASGLLLSGLLPVPSGAVIALVSSILFYGALIARPLLSRSGPNQGEI